MRKTTNSWIYLFILMGVLFMLTNSCKKDNNNPPVNTVTDIDGNLYHTVTIGTQVWMVENLNTTKYRDGTSIPNVTDGAWHSLSTGAYCDYDTTLSYSSTYGKLYNWYVVTNVHNIAPTGWHIPTDEEWTVLINYLISNGFNFDGTTVDNYCAKSLAATTNWIPSTITGAVGNTDYPTYRNNTGFTALPGGQRASSGAFILIGYNGSWWSATEVDTYHALNRSMNTGYPFVSRGENFKTYGRSVRCVKDYIK